MARTKIQLRYINSDSKRNSTLRKRKIGLKKKMHELSTLCGVKSCIVIYSPNCSEPDLWPSSSETEQAIQHYKNMPGFEKSKKMVDQDSFAQQELAKAQDQFYKIQKENKLKELDVMVNMTMSNDRGWIQSLDCNYLTFMTNHVLEQQLEKMENMIALINLDSSSTLQG